MRRLSPRIFVPMAALVLVGVLVLPQAVDRRTASEGSPPTPVPADPRSSAPGDTAMAQPAAAPASAGFDIPPEVAGHDHEWPLANHDYANTRAAVRSAI